jgi:hypothetical protein
MQSITEKVHERILHFAQDPDVFGLPFAVSDDFVEHRGEGTQEDVAGDPTLSALPLQ